MDSQMRDAAKHFALENAALRAELAATRAALLEFVGPYISGDYCGWCETFVNECECMVGRGRAVLPEYRSLNVEGGEGGDVSA